ncbi:MAG TPA: hypothetical protein VGR07_21195 [Thermoanaerobaculia bacterium]|jgi:hypothetical protein|nr:hypothetical protein [Thermoanaerobaculia bacterium]
MSIQQFLVKLESGKERSSLFVSLGRLRRLGGLRDLVQAATGDPNGAGGGWIEWQSSDAEALDCAATAGA